jgi:hypothetical protein
MKNRYTLTDEVKQKYTPIVEGFINTLQFMIPGHTIDLSDTALTPFTLVKILQNMGYEEEDQTSNGWQLDYWITLTKEDCKSLYIKGAAITFELILAEKEE